MTLKTLFCAAAVAGALAGGHSAAGETNDPASLSDVEMAHAAYTADNIDIRYAHLALAISTDPAVHEFARTMIRDHEAVNAQALGLLEKLGAEPKDNFLSRKLDADARKIIDEMSRLRGAEFDTYYAANELAYHQAVNGLVEHSFIPNIDHPEVKALFEAGLKIFKSHENHAQMVVEATGQ